MRRKKSIDSAFYRPLVLFPVPPLMGGVLQACLYGTVFVWPGMVLSLVIIYINIQNRRLSTDFLTGAFNRMQMDRYMRYMIRNAVQHPFYAILIDIDKFKEVNDKYGHVCGDEVLIATVKLLKEALNKNDFLARYGGDEFIVILETDKFSNLRRV